MIALTLNPRARKQLPTKLALPSVAPVAAPIRCYVLCWNEGAARVAQRLVDEQHDGRREHYLGLRVTHHPVDQRAEGAPGWRELGDWMITASHEGLRLGHVEAAPEVDPGVLDALAADVYYGRSAAATAKVTGEPLSENGELWITLTPGKRRRQ